MKFIVAVLVWISADRIIAAVPKDSWLHTIAAFSIFICAIYVLYKVYKFVFSGNSSNTNDSPTITKTEAPKHERRPMIHAEGSTQIVRQERLGVEKWKVVVGTFGSNGQRKEIGSSIITPSNPTFSHGSDNFSVTWA